ncbi:unnamed protein product [Nippostrongylus brasiliensis]|uniref:Protein RFT1 homolog n=1 Tax=Nippostrongylus brasiliensis TaxID=27835 RepID=A0A0N4Y2Q4_NIPBR|nr:unnamed protein product [Nippostrongylus brasiliensis]
MSAPNVLSDATFCSFSSFRFLYLYTQHGFQFILQLIPIAPNDPFILDRLLVGIMSTSSNTLEMICIVLLGLGQMCIFVGYDTQSFVAESVLHSVNGREPLRIDAYAGYFG